MHWCVYDLGCRATSSTLTLHTFIYSTAQPSLNVSSPSISVHLSSSRHSSLISSSPSHHLIATHHSSSPSSHLTTVTPSHHQISLQSASLLHRRFVHRHFLLRRFLHRHFVIVASCSSLRVRRFVFVFLHVLSPLTPPLSATVLTTVARHAAIVTICFLRCNFFHRTPYAATSAR